MFLGIEIGGTKLQLGIGPDDGRLRGLWRGAVDVSAGPEGIRRQITQAVPELLARAGLSIRDLQGAGIGFGGPVDDQTRTVIRSHQIAGWDDFPLADWVADIVGVPAVLGNDADVAGLAEALHGAGKGLSPIFYVTIGSGIGGGLIIDGEIYRGAGRGAAEIGHLLVPWRQEERRLLEEVASGWGIESVASEHFNRPVTAAGVAELAANGSQEAMIILMDAIMAIADAILHVVTLLCPRLIIVGGGVSLMGEELFFDPLRRAIMGNVFPPFEDLTDIVPAALGEEVVIHGAIALARKPLL
jgi:glucokinase